MNQVTLFPAAAPSAARPGWLTRRLVFGLTPAGALVLALMVLAALLYGVNLSAIGDGNLYYTAAVESMLQSWHNFFFVAAEPGASVTVDKPPLGLWIEALSAAVLGVNGVAVSLPNIVAAVLSVPLLYHLVKRPFGPVAGLTAALVLVVTPVAVAAARNNTMDWLLTFTLLLAAWAFLRAAETGRRRFLMLGALGVGLAFNIKMLQAYLPAPAFFALYLLTARQPWRAKLVNVAAAGVLALAVSLAWVAAVDLTPADQRPYIGSSTNNTVLELIVGHNGLSRLLGRGGDGSRAGPPPGQAGGPNGGGGPGGAGEVGVAGVGRFFQLPLAKELSWLLPLGLVALAITAAAERPRLPLASPWHSGLVLWGGWLVTCLVFFSAASFFHAYYMVMLAPALGAVIGMGVARLWQWAEVRQWQGLALAGVAALSTLALQGFLVWQMAATALIWPVLGGGAALAGLALMGLGRAALQRRAGLAVVVLALAITPLAWSWMTTLQASPNVALPAAYSGQGNPGGGGDRGRAGGAGPSSSGNPALLAYLEANTADTRYLVAVPSAMQGAPYVLATGRPVLYLGGFSGSDAVVTAADVSALVAAGDLRYILVGGNRGQANAEVTTWVTRTCAVVSGVDVADGALYDCRQ